MRVAMGEPKVYDALKKKEAGDKKMNMKFDVYGQTAEGHTVFRKRCDDEHAAAFTAETNLRVDDIRVVMILKSERIHDYIKNEELERLQNHFNHCRVVDCLICKQFGSGLAELSQAFALLTGK